MRGHVTAAVAAAATADRNCWCEARYSDSQGDSYVVSTVYS
jgi:hypothetical protein